MEEHLKNCLVALAAAMDEMQKYPEQLDDWMLSNHNYIKTDSPQLRTFLPKETIKELRKEIDDAEFEEKKSSTMKIKLPGGGEQEIQVEKTQSEAKTNSFFERAEVLKGSGKTSGKAKVPGEPEPPKSVVEKTATLKELAQRIKSEASQGITSEAGLAVMMENADPEAAAELQAVIDSGADIVSSGIALPAPTGDDDEVPSFVLNMAARAQSGPAAANARDLQTLQDMQNKVQNTQKKLGTGGFGRA